MKKTPKIFSAVIGKQREQVATTLLALEYAHNKDTKKDLANNQLS